MGLQTIQRGLWVPPVPLAYSSGAMLIDAAGEQAAFIFAVPKSGTIAKVGFLTATVTTSETLRVGLETVDPATGNPTSPAAQYGGSTPGTQVAPAANTFYTVVLVVAATAVKGDIIAAVIQFDSTVGSVNIAQASWGAQVGFPYVALYTTSWAKTSSVPVMTLEYSDGSYEVVEGAFPHSALNPISIGTGTTPDEVGNVFQLPFPCRVSGVWGYADLDGNNNVVLYDSGSNSLASVLLDSDIRATLGSAYFVQTFAVPVVLTAGAVYRLSLTPTTATQSSLWYYRLPSAAAMDSLPLGQNCCYTQRTDGGAWTDTTTQRGYMGLIIDQLDDGIRTPPNLMSMGVDIR